MKCGLGPKCKREAVRLWVRTGPHRPGGPVMALELSFWRCEVHALDACIAGFEGSRELTPEEAAAWEVHRS